MAKTDKAILNTLILATLNRDLKTVATCLADTIVSTFPNGEDRLTFIHALSDKMCLECGRVYTRIGQRCQCWNDE